MSKFWNKIRSVKDQSYSDHQKTCIKRGVLEDFFRDKFSYVQNDENDLVRQSRNIVEDNLLNIDACEQKYICSESLINKCIKSLKKKIISRD